MQTAFADAIRAETIVVGNNVTVGRGVRIRARHVTLEDGVHIGDDVHAACDSLQFGAGTRIGAGTRLISPAIRLGPRCTIGARFRAEVNNRLELGRLADLGPDVRVVAHTVAAGDHLWVTDDVAIGGGGARGSRSRLIFGHRCAVMQRCYINLSEEVAIGDDTALSNGVTILTHSTWHDVLAGGTAQFASVRIGSDCILYVNAVIAPGVTIGNHATVAAGALVLQDVPDESTAIGNPARIMRSTPAMPRVLPPERREALVVDTLRDWAESLDEKGLTATIDEQGRRVRVMTDAGAVRVSFGADAGAGDISLAFESASGAATTHFDLETRTMTGAATPLAEDLRDFLRRRTIRIYTDRPFTALRPAAIARLAAQLAHD